MTLKTDLQAAADAARTAFKTALDTEGYDESTLSELWRMYLGLKRINNDTPADPVVNSNYNFNLSSDYLNIPTDNYGVGYAADTISFTGLSEGADVISFGDYTPS